MPWIVTTERFASLVQPACARQSSEEGLHLFVPQTLGHLPHLSADSLGRGAGLVEVQHVFPDGVFCLGQSGQEAAVIRRRFCRFS